jgi:hypothetical protein
MGRDDEEKDLSSYWITCRKGGSYWKLKYEAGNRWHCVDN